MNKRKMKECSLEENSSFLKKENVIVEPIYLFFLCFFFKDFVKFKNKLRTIEPRFGKKLRTIKPHFEKHGSYKKERV